MNPYLRQDIEEQITEYWRDIHKNKWSIVSRELEDVSFDLKKDLNVPGDCIFWDVGVYVYYITFDRGVPRLFCYPNCYESPVRYLEDPVLQRYIEDMIIRWNYHGR